MKLKKELTEAEKILAKQTEVLTHQKHFNLILAVTTTFLVLIYVLKELPYSRLTNSFLYFIFIITLAILIALLIFMMKEKYPERFWNLLLNYSGK